MYGTPSLPQNGEKPFASPSPLYERLVWKQSISVVSLVQTAPADSAIASRYLAWADLTSPRNVRLVLGSPRDLCLFRLGPASGSFQDVRNLESFLYRVKSKPLNFQWFDSSSDLFQVLWTMWVSQTSPPGTMKRLLICPAFLLQLDFTIKQPSFPLLSLALKILVLARP